MRGSLQAAAVYRLEVGAASFALLYLAAMTFILALDGKGFVEFGTQGFRAKRVVQAPDKKQEWAIAEQMMLFRNTRKNLETTEKALCNAIDEVHRLQDRVNELETR